MTDDQAQEWVGRSSKGLESLGRACILLCPYPPAGKSGLQEWQGLTPRLLPHLFLLIYLEANLGL